MLPWQRCVFSEFYKPKVPNQGAVRIRCFWDHEQTCPNFGVASGSVLVGFDTPGVWLFVLFIIMRHFPCVCHKFLTCIMTQVMSEQVTATSMASSPQIRPVTALSEALWAKTTVLQITTWRCIVNYKSLASRLDLFLTSSRNIFTRCQQTPYNTNVHLFLSFGQGKAFPIQRVVFLTGHFNCTLCEENI